jgi:hypothetical protein
MKHSEVPSLGDVLSGMDTAAAQTAVDIVLLHRDFPAWAVWLPLQGIWTATRPASSRPPGPELPMLWVRGESARQLADRMRATDGQLTSG